MFFPILFCTSAAYPDRVNSRSPLNSNYTTVFFDQKHEDSKQQKQAWNVHIRCMQVKNTTEHINLGGQEIITFPRIGLFQSVLHSPLYICNN